MRGGRQSRQIFLNGLTPIGGLRCVGENTKDQERRDMNTDNTQGGAEPSPASAGSHSELYRVVRALLDGVNARYAKNPREWTCPHMQALDDMTQSEPQPALTDDEREALTYAAGSLLEQFVELGDTQDREMSGRVKAVIQRLK